LKETLPVFIAGIVLGLSLMFAGFSFLLDYNLKGKVCGDVALDKYHFERMIDDLYDCKRKIIQYDFGLEFLESELNITNQLRNLNRTAYIARQFEKFQELQEDLEEIDIEYEKWSK
jgi:hypothetical protein